MFDYLHNLLGERGLAPHGYCLLWQPELIWTHVISDALIGIAYFSIPVVIATFLTRRRDVEFSWVVWMFAAFIMACGATHFLSIWVLWDPAYGIEALVKVATAIVSVITAVALWPLLPRAVAVPSPALLQRANEALVTGIAERDAALDALEQATRERQRTEELLRQAQKMEAVGQLTGGIAHDFNNLLTVVIANLDRARRMGPGDGRLTKYIDNAMMGADRAARLTDQLLAFSRKQPLQPTAQQLNRTIADLAGLAEQTLGAGIALDLDLAPGLPPVEIDRNQTENALLNLIINARDAMPDGGRLSIATALADGDVTVTIADTGTGMPPEVTARAFEPFFTTKGLGEGTGLGLSQVYGFIKQSGGDIAIASVPGKGTTITMRLPVGGRDGGNGANG